jgi:putative sigma-54 modulation protein
MQITVKGKNMEITEALKTFTEKRLGKMTKYSDSIISTDITLSTERNWHIVEVTLYGNGFMLRGAERTKDMYMSIDQAIEKMERQLKKQKEKIVRKRAHEKEEGAIIEEAVRPAAAAHAEEPISYEPKVEVVKRFSSRPMTVEEAIKEIEGLDYSFFVFHNSKTKRVNVLYRRQKGYGLIDPLPE